MIKKRGQANIALLVIALGLVWFLKDKSKPVPTPATPKLSKVKAAAITDITIRRQGHAQIVLKRKGTQWFLQQPISARADQFRVEALTNVADSTPHDRFDAPKTRLRAFGLAPPQAVLTLNDQKILVGRRRPFGDLRYILIGHTIALVPAEVIHPRRLTSDSFISSELLSARIRPVAFTLPRFTVARDRGIWKVTPMPARLSNDRINTFVEGWRYARALSVSRYHHHRLPIGRVIIRYRMASHKKPLAKPVIKTLDVDILTTRPELILLRPDQGLLYHFPAEIGKHLLHLNARAGTS